MRALTGAAPARSGELLVAATMHGASIPVLGAATLAVQAAARAPAPRRAPAPLDAVGAVFFPSGFWMGTSRAFQRSPPPARAPPRPPRRLRSRQRRRMPCRCRRKAAPPPPLVLSGHAASLTPY